jgi:riboflavin synthase
MFTGIVEHVGTVASVAATPGGRRLAIDVGPMAAECALGASVAVSGVCLTVAAAKPPILEFDVITETLDRSTLGGLTRGGRVNLERSLRVGDRLDGHFVQGHVDGRAAVTGVLQSPKEWVVSLRPEDHLRPYIVPKGSITLDGVSLTIAAVEGDVFTVALIPTTLERTTLGGLVVRDAVNVESDIVARTVVHWLSHHQAGAAAGSGLTLAKLQEAGFA